MIVDASALVAIAADEPEARSFLNLLEQATNALTHPISVYEAATAIRRIAHLDTQEARTEVLALLEGLGIGISSIGPAEVFAALDAFDRFGKGNHPAGLNMGDCFSYACARTRGMPLLYKGEDFAQTDIAPA